MTPLAHLASTLAVAAAAIAVYDIAVVQKRESVPIGAPREPEASAPASVARADEPAPPPLLLGAGDERWRLTFERRLAALEVHGESRREPGAGAGPTSPVGAPRGVSTDATVGSPTDATDGTAGTEPVRPEEVRRFRQVLEAAEREIQLEKATRQVHEFLDKVGAKLTEAQRRSVVGTALKFQGKWREMSKEQPKGEAQIQERKDAYAKVMAEFEQEIRNVVPGVEANLIIDGIRRAGKEPPK